MHPHAHAQVHQREVIKELANARVTPTVLATMTVVELVLAGVTVMDAHSILVHLQDRPSAAGTSADSLALLRPDSGLTSVERKLDETLTKLNQALQVQNPDSRHALSVFQSNIARTELQSSGDSSHGSSEISSTGSHQPPYDSDVLIETGAAVSLQQVLAKAENMAASKIVAGMRGLHTRRELRKGHTARFTDGEREVKIQARKQRISSADRCVTEGYVQIIGGACM